MPRRERTAIAIHPDAKFIEVGAKSRIIVQPNEYEGRHQVQVASQSPRFGRRPEFADVLDDELTVEMCNIKHGANITPELLALLNSMMTPAEPTSVRRARARS